MSDNENVKIGFLNIKDIGDEGDLRGVMLVTDGSTYPIELRYSDPVRATILEKLTFGITLKDGITIERVARPLVESFNNKPSIIFIKDDTFLKLQKHTKITIACIPDSSRDTEYTFFSDDPHYSKKIESIIEEFPEIDLQEPFDRLDRVLDFVHYESDEDFEETNSF